MGNTANQVRCNSNSLTRVREEVERLGYCLEGLCDERNYAHLFSDLSNFWALCQEREGLDLDLR